MPSRLNTHPRPTRSATRFVLTTIALLIVSPLALFLLADLGVKLGLLIQILLG